MNATIEYCFLTLSSEETDILYDAMNVYQPAMDSDFTTDPAFLRLVSDAKNALNLHVLSSAVHIAAMEISVWYSAVNYLLDVENLPEEKAKTARALVCELAPYCDYETDPVAYYARKDHEAKMRALYEKFLMEEANKK